MPSPGPLHGFRIIDLTSNISGPLATMILADQGADVIKVENPQGGDHTRASANRRGGFSATMAGRSRSTDTGWGDRGGLWRQRRPADGHDQPAAGRWSVCNDKVIGQPDGGHWPALAGPRRIGDRPALQR